MMPNDDGYELKRDGWGLVLTVSALWQSTGVAKAQKQIETFPTNPTKFPSRGSGVPSAVYLHTGARGHLQVGIFALGLSFIVHINI